MVPIEPSEPLEPFALRGVTGIVAGSVCDYGIPVLAGSVCDYGIPVFLSIYSGNFILT